MFQVTVTLFFRGWQRPPRLPLWTPYSVLNLFRHLGMLFLGISKNVRGCVILVHTEKLTGAKICVAHVSKNLISEKR